MPGRSEDQQSREPVEVPGETPELKWLRQCVWHSSPGDACQPRSRTEHGTQETMGPGASL